MKISVLIVTYQRPEHLRRCLRALAGQVRLPDEVIVAGVAGDTATAAVAAAAAQEYAGHCPFPCRWLAAAEPGVARQTNLGVQACQGDVIAYTNDDAEPFPDWLARIEPYYADPTVGGVGGRDYVHTGPGQALDGPAGRVGQVAPWGRVYGNHHLAYPAVTDVDVLKGVNMSLRRALARPLDLRLAGGGRWHWELDACLPLRRAGWRLVYDPRICVDHFHGPRPDTLDPDFVQGANHNLTLILMQHLPRARRALFLIYTFLWGDYPEFGLAVFSRTYLQRLIRQRDVAFGRLLGSSLRGKIDGLRALAGRTGQRDTRLPAPGRRGALAEGVRTTKGHEGA